MSKTNKTLADFADQQPIYKVELEIFDTKANHNKFWRCYIFSTPGVGMSHFVVRHWGRNGTKGQQMVESFYGKYEAQDSAERLTAEKRAKGYRAEASPLDKIIREV